MRTFPLTLGLALAGAAIAQQATSVGQQQPAPSSTATLNLPANPQLFGTALPSVVKATAIVNGEVITQTDIDQRLALLAIANNAPIPANQLDRLRQQVLKRSRFRTPILTGPSSASPAIPSKRRSKWRTI